MRAIERIRTAYAALCSDLSVPHHGIRAGLHVGDTLVTEFGRAGLKDAMGKGIAVAMNLDGDGVTLTESVYRSLPNAERSGFRKHAGRVTYRAA